MLFHAAKRQLLQTRIRFSPVSPQVTHSFPHAFPQSFLPENELFSCFFGFCPSYPHPPFKLSTVPVDNICFPHNSGRNILFINYYIFLTLLTHKWRIFPDPVRICQTFPAPVIPFSPPFPPIMRKRKKHAAFIHVFVSSVDKSFDSYTSLSEGQALRSREAISPRIRR